MTNTTAHLFVTIGEPAGIGPDILIQYLQSPLAKQLVAITDQNLLLERAEQLGLPLKVVPFRGQQQDHFSSQNGLPVIHVPLQNPVTCGQLDPANAEFVLQTLRTAINACQSSPGSALVTGPLHKGIINDAGIPFTGHTEFLAEQTDTHQVVMMLACPGLRVALVTTHLPLQEVSRAITAERLESVIKTLHQDMRKRFAIDSPHIIVCGLNPHAGENGHLGKEEIEVIEPVLKHLRKQGIQLTGPLSADTVFIPKYLEQADVVLSMYHDQGLPVLKHMGFGQAVNITLGLPFIRTSVDHGTALELAGSGQADTGSLEMAIETAHQMLHSSQLYKEPDYHGASTA